MKKPDESQRLLFRTLWFGGAAAIIVPLNFVVFFWASEVSFLTPVFFMLAGVQLVCGAIGARAAWRYARFAKLSGVGLLLFCGLVALGGPTGAALAAFFMGSGGLGVGGALGGAWGRPLRLRGRIVHPELRAGSDWTRGDRPSTAGLDEATRRALEALWLHDAQKEHASVPAFSRLSWQLIAVGAPANLVEAVHVAALEEIDHTRRCFALAAGYGGRSHSAEPMPDLLLGGALDLPGRPLEAIAVESLKDGCLLEDFNADVAAACAAACLEPVTRDVLERIAREERAHAELSWKIVAFCVERGGAPVRRAVERAAGELAGVARPTAASAEKADLVARADAAALRRHGRLPDTEWAALWSARVEQTATRLLEGAPHQA